MHINNSDKKVMYYPGNKIEAIIFDLGGVILNIDLTGTFKKFKALGIGPDQEAHEIIKNHNIFNRFEIGELRPESFRNEIRKISHNHFENPDFDEIWNSMILDFPEENIRFLESIRTKYRTFLMSNTNLIHYHHYSKILHAQFGYTKLDDLFEKAYYSHTSGMRKPHRDFFTHILTENGLKAENTLFIDDFEENITAAGQIGLKTVHLINGRKLTDLLLS